MFSIIASIFVPISPKFLLGTRIPSGRRPAHLYSSCRSVWIFIHFPSPGSSSSLIPASTAHPIQPSSSIFDLHLLSVLRQRSKCTGDCLSWLTDLVAVLRLRRGENADSLNALGTDHTAGSIQDRITNEFGDNGIGRGLDSFNFVKGLVKIIDDYTPL